jgi:hypothetical protein
LVLLSAVLTAGLLYHLYQKMAPSAEPTVAHTIGGTGVAVRSVDAPIPNVHHTLSSRGIDVDGDKPVA